MRKEKSDVVYGRSREKSCKNTEKAKKKKKSIESVRLCNFYHQLLQTVCQKRKEENEDTT